MPSVYRDTALIQSDVDLRKERRMTLDKFRRKYLSQMGPRGAMRALMPADQGERMRANHREASKWHSRSDSFKI